MNGYAIEAVGISKRYRLGARRSGYATLADTLQGRLRRTRDAGASDSAMLWALRDVGFTIEPGETVAFVGRNGAGKSTLLKILSRITKPTEGHAVLYGRVGSLLEVGTGFHAELTGRENIYLNGAILGLRRTEIDRRFDDIVAFAEMERFLDTPVKRYSSGMTVRLAFAVAAHLEPEILLIDEVLAVGDVAFQRKCLGKMSEVAAEGRTVIFVSHNMAVIQALCQRGILLVRGTLQEDGPVADVVARYLDDLEATAVATVLADRDDRAGRREVLVEQIAIEGAGSDGQLFTTGGSIRFDFLLSGLKSGTKLAFTLHDQLGTPICTLSNARAADGDRHIAGGEPVVSCFIPELPLVPGRYRLDYRLEAGGHKQDQVEGAAFFDVAEGLLRGRPVAQGEGRGVVAVACDWTSPE
jgi:lipopolysaccharide transport system ATP-binding protein